MFRDGNLLRRYSKDIRAEDADYPISTHSAVRAVIGKPVELYVYEKMRYLPRGTPIHLKGPDSKDIILLATGLGNGAGEWTNVLHNAHVLGIYNPATNKFGPPPTQIKVHPQESPAGPAK